MTVALSPNQQALLGGEAGPAVSMAMRVVVSLARLRGASRLRVVTSAHLDGCLYHGLAGLDFAERLVELGGRVSVPTTLNVGSLDLLHPEFTPGENGDADQPRRLMNACVALGAEPTWTCTPYQVGHRPALGEHVAWAESNAIAFCNSVLGARTDRYGDFLDASAAITGLVPDAGLHLDHNRYATVILDCRRLSRELKSRSVLYPVLGFIAGREAGIEVPVFVGLDAGQVDEDKMKALGATAASAGGVALFHIVGVTPEAATLKDALGGRTARSARTLVVDEHMVRAAREALTTAHGSTLDAVSLGTPHFSLAELKGLAELTDGGQSFDPSIEVWVSTSRFVLEQARMAGYTDPIESAGARILTDTCTYVTPVLSPSISTVMTNSGNGLTTLPAISASASCTEASRNASPQRERGGSCVMTDSGADFLGITLHSGVARGAVLALDSPLSFWGGSDVESGRITDERHPQRGMSLAGRVLVMHSGRGSSSSSSVLAEQIRRGVGPAAILLSETDTIIVMGTIVAAELYDVYVPIVLLSRAHIDAFANDAVVSVDAAEGGATIRVLGCPNAEPENRGIRP